MQESIKLLRSQQSQGSTRYTRCYNIPKPVLSGFGILVNHSFRTVTRKRTLEMDGHPYYGIRENQGTSEFDSLQILKA